MNENNRYREEEREEEEVAKEEKENETGEENNSSASVEQSQARDERMMELEAEIARLQDQLLRNRAELENFKRRNNEERIRERKYALQDFFTDFIQVADILDKAVKTSTDDDKLNRFLTGFKMINLQIQQLLEQYGVKKIETLNKKFDPALHSASETVCLEDHPDGEIIEEIITGYYYKDRVLRPSVVRVNKLEEKVKEEK